MAGKILIVKNKSHEGPGWIGTFLRGKEILCEFADLDRGEEFPSPNPYGALIVLGGPDSANDKTEKVERELERIREILFLNKPYLGICLGLQLLVKAGGGSVVKSPVKEIAFRAPDGEFFQVALTEEGRKDPFLQGIRDHFPVFHLHGETVKLTKEMVLLGTGTFCPNQLVRVGKNAYGLQGHLELTAEMLEEWLKKDPDLSMQDPRRLRDEFKSLQKEYEQTARQLLTNFLNLAGYREKSHPLRA